MSFYLLICIHTKLFLSSVLVLNKMIIPYEHKEQTNGPYSSTTAPNIPHAAPPAEANFPVSNGNPPLPLALPPPSPGRTESKGGGFWRGCCLGWCFYCCLDACF